MNGDLGFGRTVSVAFGVVRRRGVWLLLAWLAFDGATDCLEWFAVRTPDAQAPGALPAVLLMHLLGAVVGGALFAGAAAHLVRGDTVVGRVALPVFRIPGSRMPQLILLWTLLAAPRLLLALPALQNAGIGVLQLAAAVLDLSAYAVVGLAAAMALDARPSAGEFWREFARLTRGSRIQLIAMAIVIVALQWIAATAADVISTIMAAPTMRLDGAESAFNPARLPGYFVLNLFAIFLTVWGAVAYFALRRRAEGLGDDDVDIFA